MIKPFTNYVVLIPKKTQTPSGIVLTENVKESNIAIVSNVSDDEKEIKVNDVVIFKNSTANEFNHLNQKYWIVEKKDIMAVIKDE